MLERRRRRTSRGPAHPDGTIDRRAVRRLPRGAYTVRWHAISADSHVVSGVWTFGVGVPAPAVDERLRRRRPDARPSISCAGSGSSASPSRSASLGLRLIVLRGLAVPRRLERRIAVAAGRRRARQPACGHRRVLAALGGRAAAAVRTLPLRDLSPMAATRFGRAFVVMTLGFALVLALVYLSWLLERVEPSSCRRSCSRGPGRRASRSPGHDAVDAGSSWKTELADWVHIAAASLWIGGLADARRPRLVRGAVAAAGRVRALLAARDGAVAVVLGAGMYLSIVRLPRLSRPVVDRLRPRAAREDRARLASRSPGARSTTSSSRPLSHAPTTASSRASAAASPAESLVGVAVLLAAAVLVDSRPPQQPIRTSDRQSQAPRAAVTIATVRVLLASVVDRAHRGADAEGRHAGVDVRARERAAAASGSAGSRSATSMRIDPASGKVHEAHQRSARASSTSPPRPARSGRSATSRRPSRASTRSTGEA